MLSDPLLIRLRLKGKEVIMNFIKFIALICTVMFFSSSSYASHCGGSHTHDHKKMAEKKEILEEPVMEESSEVAVASNSEEESTEDQDSEADTETR